MFTNVHTPIPVSRPAHGVGATSLLPLHDHENWTWTIVLFIQRHKIAVRIEQHASITTFIATNAMRTNVVQFNGSYCQPFLGTLVKSLNMTISFVMSLRQSVPSLSPNVTARFPLLDGLRIYQHPLYEPNLSPYKYPNISQTQSPFTPTCLWRWNRQIVPKRRHIKYRRRGITQKKSYNKRYTSASGLFLWWGECLGLRGTRWQGSGENCVMRSLMICTAHHILFGWLNRE